MLVLLGGCASRQSLYWDAADLSRAPDSTVTLRNPGQAVGAVIQVARVRKAEEVKARIEEVARLHARLVVAVDTAPNAFAAPGHPPVVGITTGMLDLLGHDDDAYAALLGHEYGHLVLRHGEARAQREAPRTVGKAALGVILGAVVPFGGALVDVGAAAVEAAFTRDEERDADREGFKYAVEAGYDPRGAVRLWEKMQARSSGFAIPFLNTHPVTKERVETMKTLVATVSETLPAAVANAGQSGEIEAVDPYAREQVAVGRTVYGAGQIVTVRAAPYEDATVVERVSRYSGLRVERVREDWIRVQTQGGTEGWMRRDKVRLVLE